MKVPGLDLYTFRSYLMSLIWKSIMIKVMFEIKSEVLIVDS